MFDGMQSLESGASGAQRSSSHADQKSLRRLGRWRSRRARPVRARRVREAGRCLNPYGDPGGDAEEIELDVRDLPLEGRIGRTLARMEELSEHQRLRHINAEIPWPLLPMLETRGYRYRLVGRVGGDIHILAWVHSDGGHSRSSMQSQNT